MDSPTDSKTHLDWGNVGLGFAFVVFDAIISRVFGLGVGVPLITAAIRCIIQLAIMALVLQRIFEADNPWGVSGIACKALEVLHMPRKTDGPPVLLNLLGTIEVGTHQVFTGRTSKRNL